MHWDNAFHLFCISPLDAKVPVKELLKSVYVWLATLSCTEINLIPFYAADMHFASNYNEPINDDDDDDEPVHYRIYSSIYFYHQLTNKKVS